MSSESYDAARRIIRTLREQGHEALLAGGCVRDHLLGREPQDHDVATDAPPERVCALFRRTKKVGAKFGVVIVRLGGCEVEVATFRTDGDYADGRHPDEVHFATARLDAQRRDFTINGMFYDPFTDTVVDYVNGQSDLAAGLVRCIGDPARRFAEDHLRMLRAVRFAARLGFAIESGTFAAIRGLAGHIRAISPERVRMELELILAHPTRARAWPLLEASGLVEHMAAPAAWSPAACGQVTAVLAALPADAPPTACLAAALTCFTPSQASEICRGLRCSNEQTDATVFLLEHLPWALRGAALELADVKMLLESPWFANLPVLARGLAQAQAIPLNGLEALVSRAAAVPAEQIAPPPLVGGEDLLAWDIPQGPLYSTVLAEVYRAQRNDALSDRPAALAMLRALLVGHGLLRE